MEPSPAEWVRRARLGELSGFVVGGVPVEPLGRVGRVLVVLGVLADDETSARLSAVDVELDALEHYRRFHQAHPMSPALDPEFDALWAGIRWSGEAPIAD